MKSNEIMDVKNFIRDNTKKLINKAIKYKNKKSNLLSKQRFLPTKYVRVYIYDKNSRERSFYDSSVNDHLIAILQLNRSGKIKNILPIFGLKEDNKYCTICWSKNHPLINLK